MTSEKTKDESTIITSSRVSIFGAAVEPCWPSQLMLSITADITTVSPTVAASIFAIGRRPIWRAGF